MFSAEYWLRKMVTSISKTPNEKLEDRHGDRQKPRSKYYIRIGIPWSRYETIMGTSKDEIDYEINTQLKSII